MKGLKRPPPAAFVVLLLFLAACRGEGYRLTVLCRDSFGLPVAGAAVVVDRRNVQAADELGVARFKVRGDEPHEVSVSPPEGRVLASPATRELTPGHDLFKDRGALVEFTFKGTGAAPLFLLEGNVGGLPVILGRDRLGKTDGLGDAVLVAAAALDETYVLSLDTGGHERLLTPESPSFPVKISRPDQISLINLHFTVGGRRLLKELPPTPAATAEKTPGPGEMSEAEVRARLSAIAEKCRLRKPYEKADRLFVGAVDAHHPLYFDARLVDAECMSRSGLYWQSIRRYRKLLELPGREGDPRLLYGLMKASFEFGECGWAMKQIQRFRDDPALLGGEGSAEKRVEVLRERALCLERDYYRNRKGSRKALEEAVSAWREYGDATRRLEPEARYDEERIKLLKKNAPHAGPGAGGR